MRYIIGLLFLGMFQTTFAAHGKKRPEPKLFTADNSHIQYTGRVDFSNPMLPRFWSPGVYIKAKFKGASCQVIINDEVLGGNNHNYIEVVVDDKAPYRIKLSEKTNVIKVADSLSNGEHTVLICKDTESNIGYIELVGFKCEKLLSLPAKPKFKIEYIGDSITAGAGMDLSVVPCNTGAWYDQHNAYMTYGALTSRSLNAQWQLTALAGVGLVHSCCNMNVVMPQIFDKVSLRADTIKWDFKHYQPDMVTICLGQNDGAQDSSIFCNYYIKFIGAVRSAYPKADIVCLSSPMADEKLTPVLRKYLTAIITRVNSNGDQKVYKYFFSRRFHNGCGDHPDLAEHKLIAAELTAFIKGLKGW
ncbi:SGNH/GDSL hydrolase family protein [soil metagenome]|jgi:lysophospholipase L1-like esterase